MLRRILFVSLSTMLAGIVGCQPAASTAPIGSSASTQPAFPSGSSADAPAAETDSLAEVKSLVEANQAVLLDVRSAWEWEGSHLAQAMHIPTNDLKDAARRAELTANLPKDKPIYVHCAKGVRAVMCAEVLAEMGFDARPLKVDYQQLVDTGFSTGP